MFALIDCNNFFASCERLFRPDLHDKPIVVLSNNDGCVIARSNEAKVLGIAMGVPFFQVKTLCKQHQVSIFSSNYTLYRDLSERVMTVIQDSWKETEIYSIDEAFLDLKSLPQSDRDVFCVQLQKKILKHTGLPTSIGLGSTKTLAKAANYIAKKKLDIPVFNITGQDHWLSKLDVGDIWGIGRQWQKKLVALGVHTAADLAQMNPQMAQRMFNVVLQSTIMELNHISCHGLAVQEPNKSIVSSRSFGTLQTEYNNLAEAISGHCATAWNRMRAQGLSAQHISVFIRSNRFRADLPYYANSAGFPLITPSDDLCDLTRFAKFCLKKIFKPEVYYYKCGVLLTELRLKNFQQMDLFHQPSMEKFQQSEKIMQAMELINGKYGIRTIHLAAEGFKKSWSMKRQLKSPAYTTQWSELPVVY